MDGDDLTRDSVYIAPPLRSNFFSLSLSTSSVMRPFHPLPPLLATMIPSTTEAITYAKRRERGRSNEPSTIGTRLSPGSDLCPFSTPISAVLEKRGCVWGPVR